MNDPLDLVERLAAGARRETPEPPDVAPAVLRRLRTRERAPLAWMTAVAVAVAVLAVMLAGMPGTDMDALDAVFQAANFIQTEGSL